MARRWLCVVLVLPLCMMRLAPVNAQNNCPLPEGYLEGLFNDLSRIGEEIGQVDTSNPNEVALFYVRVYQTRHRYENDIENLPDCALRGQLYFINILSSWEDILGLTLAASADPEFAEDYIAEISVINERIRYFTPILLDTFFPSATPTPIPPTETPIPILSVFYVATEAVNVRSGAGANFPSIGILTGGTQVSVVALDTLDSGDVWYEILYDSPITDDNNGRGWIFGRFLSAQAPPQFSTPAPTPTP